MFLHGSSNHLLFQSYFTAKWDTDKHKSYDFLMNPICIILYVCLFELECSAVSCNMYKEINQESQLYVPA